MTQAHPFSGNDEARAHEAHERRFIELMAGYNPGYLTPDSWSAACKESFSRVDTLARKMAYEIWKDHIARVSGEQRLLLPEHAPQKRTYDMPNGDAVRHIPHRFIARSILNHGKIKAIGEVLRQFPKDYHDTAVRLVHGGWLHYEKYSFRDRFLEIMRKDAAGGTRITRSIFGRKYSFSISPYYLMKGTALVVTEAALAAYHTVRARAHQYQDASEPAKLQDGQKPKAVVFLCHDSREDAQTMLDVPGLGRVFIDRTVGGIIEDANDPMVLNDTAVNAFTHAMHSGAKEIILSTHGKCGCVKNGICQHGVPAIPTMTIDGQVLHQLAGTIRYGVDAVLKGGEQGKAMRDYALSLFDMEGAEQTYINGEANMLAVEALTGLHRLALTRNFVANYTASAWNTPLEEKQGAGDITGARDYLNALHIQQKITAAAYHRLRTELDEGRKALLTRDDVIPEVKVRLMHHEIRTLDTHLWNDDAARFVRMTHNRALTVDPDESPSDKQERSGAIRVGAGAFNRLTSLFL